eukprot:3956393-Amphidinium_carterae.1
MAIGDYEVPLGMKRRYNGPNTELGLPYPIGCLVSGSHKCLYLCVVGVATQNTGWMVATRA